MNGNDSEKEKPMKLVRPPGSPGRHPSSTVPGERFRRAASKAGAMVETFALNTPHYCVGTVNFAVWVDFAAWYNRFYCR